MYRLSFDNTGSFTVSLFTTPGCDGQSCVPIERMKQTVLMSLTSSPLSNLVSGPMGSLLRTSAFPCSLIFLYSIVWLY